MRVNFSVIFIQRKPNEEGCWLISTGDSPNEDVWGSYATPELAADDIFMQETGNDTWDYLKSVPDDIGDIGEWKVSL